MKYMILVAVVCIVMVYVYITKQGHKVKIGDKAPNFTLLDESGNPRSLASFGNTVVVYFYPKDETPGCTSEACSLRDGYAQLQKNNITIVGISYDSPESHAAFKKNHALPFTLLSDTNKEVARAYGAYTPIMARRMTFLIHNGVIKEIFTDVDVNNHSAQIIAAFNKQ